MMGEARPDNGVSVSDTQNLMFSETVPDDPEFMSSDLTQAPPADGSSVDLIRETAELVEAFKDIDNKQEFLTLLHILIGSYQRFNTDLDLAPVFDRVVALSKEKLVFPVTLADLQSNRA
ncbi:hypothetical protein [Mucilaginibacter humi]|nr:hypothetical protein [Mucilaginibacter humi]